MNVFKTFLIAALAYAVFGAFPVLASAQSPDAASKVARPMKNWTPKPAEPAFLWDLTKPFDRRIVYIHDYAIPENWHMAAIVPRNVRFNANGASLKLEKRRTMGKPYAGAEIQRLGHYGYGRYEAVLKPPAGEGVVSAFFTHTFELFDDPHDEVDIEFLGKRPTALHLNYFKDSKPFGSIWVELGFDWSKNFHLYAFEWDPDEIRWYVDGKLIHVERGPNPPIPVAPSRVLLQIWTPANNSPTWAGRIKLPKPVYLEARCISHVPKGETAPQCSDTFVPPAK